VRWWRRKPEPEPTTLLSDGSRLTASEMDQLREWGAALAALDHCPACEQCTRLNPGMCIVDRFTRRELLHPRT
jgi:hypothetical protein